MAKPNFNEIGSIGLKQSFGRIDEEFLANLKGAKWAKAVREMSTNDPVVGAPLFMFEHQARQVDWWVDAVVKDDPQAEDVAAFASGALFDDMNHSWTEILSEILGGMLESGWSYHNTVPKRRLGPQPTGGDRASSKFNDGKIGFQKWAIRSQDSLLRWEFDDHGGIRGMTQQTYPSFKIVTIPIEQALLFRTTTRRNNPEGTSILRRMYRPWIFKKMIEENEGIGIARNCAGMPKLTAPEGLDLWNEKDANASAQKDAAERLVRSVGRDEQEGLLLPFGWNFELVTASGGQPFNTTEIINRYSSQLLMSILADFIMIGHEKAGSWALHDSKTKLLAVALGSFLGIIAGVINRHALPRLMEWNGINPELTPILRHGDIETPDLAKLGAYLTALSGAGIDLTEPGITRAMLSAASLPLPPEGEEDVVRQDRQGMVDGMADEIRKLREELNAMKGGVS